MPRNISTTIASEAAKPSVRQAHMFTGYFPEDVVRLTDAAVNISYGGNVWFASGLLGFSSSEETAELTVTRTTVTLSNADLSAAALLLRETYFNRRATVSLVFMDASLQVIGAPSVWVDGRMDKPVLNVDPDAGTCTGAVDVVSWLEPLQAKRGRHMTDEDQQRIFPGDVGLSGVKNIPPRLYWSDKFMKLGHS